MFHHLDRKQRECKGRAPAIFIELEISCLLGRMGRERLLAREELSIGRQLPFQSAGLQAIEHAPSTLIGAISICDYKAFSKEDPDMRVDLSVVNL